MGQVNITSQQVISKQVHQTGAISQYPYLIPQICRSQSTLRCLQMIMLTYWFMSVSINQHLKTSKIIHVQVTPEYK